MDSSIWSRALSLLFPPYCVVCLRDQEAGESFEMLCSKCFLGVRQVAPDTHALAALKKVIYYGSYADGSLETLVHAFKYQRVKSLAIPLGEFMARALEDGGIEGFCQRYQPVITFIPLHPFKERWRGYNQSRLLALFLADYFSLPFLPLLKREWIAPAQASLDKKEHREKNIKGAFSLLVSRVPSHIIMVDDVVTSGATLKTAALLLRKAGANVIWGVTVAGVSRH